MTITKYSIVVVEHSSDAFLVKCGYCDGSGYSNGKCGVCSGIGKVWLKIPSEWNGDIGVLKCGYCKGSGHSNGRCGVCGGVGSVWVENMNTY